ncbi:hypothetical protein [Streptomyces sp. NPDC002855]|uniref:hypothetical protein n=1 Tax=Streptomyces sp. NPDC002855 TaxID=3154437 RepID=UPI00332F8B0B
MPTKTAAKKTAAPRRRTAKKVADVVEEIPTVVPEVAEETPAMTESAVEWVAEVPATVRRGGGRKSTLQPVAESLAENPGNWARIAVREKSATANGVAVRFRKIQIGEGKFESTVRQTGDTEFSVYARYVTA